MTVLVIGLVNAFDYQSSSSLPILLECAVYEQYKICIVRQLCLYLINCMQFAAVGGAVVQ